MEAIYGEMKSCMAENRNKLIKIINKLSIDDGKYICRVIYRDPFKDIYPFLIIVYIFILSGFLLWPYDFISKTKNDTHWIENSNGIEFLGIGQAVSNASTKELFDRLVNGKGMTLEVWLETEDLNQAGPARILTYSKNKGLCNFNLAQAFDKLIFRLRTTKTSLGGASPSLVIPDTFSSRSLKHVVITYDFSDQKVYFNGEQRAQSTVLKGDFSNWDPSYELVIGNEVTGDRPWKGKIYYVAVFDRGLTELEIHQNYISRLRMLKEGGIKPSSLSTKYPITRYIFDEGKGDVIHDSGLSLKPVNLFIPEYIKYKKESFFSYLKKSLKSMSRFSDLIINILIFIPLGILINGALRKRYGLKMKISIIALFTGTLFSLSVESLQYFSMTRNSSLIDVFTNMTGVAIGVVLYRVYNFYLNYKAEHLQILLYDRDE